MFEELKRLTYEANLKLPQNDLVKLTWGNVSVIDRKLGVVSIKPSGVDYNIMKADDIVVVDMYGETVDGHYRPSSDLPTHLELYRKFETIGGIVHVHSRCATAFAQAERDIPCYGTTHADYFYGTIPCTRALTEEEIQYAYEHNTASVIIEKFIHDNIDPLAMPAVVVCKHGAFTWGATADKAVENAITLEESAHLALITEQLCCNADISIQPAPQRLLDKHYFRKHGAGAYYGQ